MAIVNLKFGSRDKYGLVRVLNPDLTLNREFRITNNDMQILKQSRNGIPPGVTPNEWTSSVRINNKTIPLCVVIGKAMDVGDIQITLSNELVVKYDEQLVNGFRVDSVAVFRSIDWVGIPPNVSVAQLAVDAIPNQPINSIINGIMNLKAIVIPPPL